MTGSSNDPNDEVIAPEIDTTATDRSLLGRYRRGDDDAATELYLRYAKRLHALAENKSGADLKQRVDSEDLVQSVFRTFFRRVVDGQYEIPDGDELWKLLLVIGLNKLRSWGSYHRAIKRNIGKTDSGGTAEIALGEASGDDRSSLQVLEMTIDELISPMPNDCQEIIRLRIAGYDINDISLQTKRSKRSVERILQEFRKKLGELIHDST